MRWLADFVYLFLATAYLPVALYHALVVGKNRRGWRERFGGVRRFDPQRKRIWIHAVSLGEINATPRLVAELRRRLPDHDVVFSTTTDTGFARAVELFGAEQVFRFPLDFSLVIGRVLRRVRPSLIVLMELEVWFNLTRMAARRGIPVAVVNGRMTRRSARRLRWLGPAARSMFREIRWVGAQDEQIAERFRSVGVPGERVEVTSSLKWDTAQVTDEVDGDIPLALALGIDAERPLWVCGSTGPGEEALLLGTYRRLLSRWTSIEPSSHHDGPPGNGDCPPPLLALIPRKPERFEEVARQIQDAGFHCVRRSGSPDGSEREPCANGAVLLGDSMGELRKFYALADVVFVGRSLVPLGGSDPMEVAALGKPMVIGPHTENFEAPVEAFNRENAIRIVDSADELPFVIGTILKKPHVGARLGARARETVLRHQGATARTAEQLARLASPK